MMDIYKKSEEAIKWADEKKDNILGNDHDLSESEVNTCWRILWNIKLAMDVFEEDKKKYERRGGYTVRMAKDIIFLMACLAERSKEEEEEDEKKKEEK